MEIGFEESEVSIQHPTVAIVEGASVEMSAEEKETFLNGVASRREITEFLNGYFLNEIVGSILDNTNQRDNYAISLIGLIFHVLVDKKVISQQEMDALFAQWNAKTKQAYENLGGMNTDPTFGVAK